MGLQVRHGSPRPPAREEIPLKADAFSQLKLLDVQELDAQLDLLRHRRATLPELRELADLEVQRSDVSGRTRDAQIELDDLTREQKKADADVEQVKARRVRDQDRMDKGLVTNPKDLERMQQELVSLARRISDLEDAELEVMEKLETVQGEHAELSAALAQLESRRAELITSRDGSARAIDDEVAKVTAERATAASGVPADLLALYEKVRAQKGGVGAAALVRRRCTGCSLDLNASDLGVIAKAPTDEVLRCEECNRILVRTSESGI